MNIVLGVVSAGAWHHELAKRWRLISDVVLPNHIEAHLVRIHNILTLLSFARSLVSCFVRSLIILDVELSI